MKNKVEVAGVSFPKSESITEIAFLTLCDIYNNNHAHKVSIDVNACQYRYVNIGPSRYGPFSLVEAYFFLTGFKQAKELLA